MGSTPVCTIDRTGIHKPLFADCLSYFENVFKNIYGSDMYWAPDDRDTQFMSLLGTALDDVNSEALAVYNAFSPSTAQGVGLSRVVKLNGISRLVPSYSTCPVVIVGVAGTVITNGAIYDDADIVWNLPASVTIPSSGQTTQTATCSQLGAVQADIGSLSTIATPTFGWQTVDNIVAATTGNPVESDGALRIRQAYSASLPASSTIDALRAAIAAIPNVTSLRVYSNDGPEADPVYGIPPYSIAVVANGGDLQKIADIVHLKKNVGVSTYGSTKVMTTPDVFGLSKPIYVSPRTGIPVTVRLTVKGLGGFTVDTRTSIRNSVSDWINSLGIGEVASIGDAYMAARLFGGQASSTFRIVPDSLVMARQGAVPTPDDVVMAYNETPYCEPGYVTVWVTA